VTRQKTRNQGQHPKEPASRRERSARPFDAVKAPEPGGTGADARSCAVACLVRVLERGQSLDDALSAVFGAARFAALSARDRAFARLIVATVLRRHGELTAILTRFLSKPLPAKFGHVRQNLLSASAQLLCLGTPAHAAISLAVEVTRAERPSAHLDRLTNAVLRRVAAEGPALLAGLDAVGLDIPDWMLARWERAYGPETARMIGEASLRPAALDISVKADAAHWAKELGGRLLPTGSVRVPAEGPIEALPGFREGAWWVQDAAAALPHRLLGDVRGQEVADLCAAPGGKTMALAAAGARVTAVDQSGARLERLKDNLRRTRLEADCIEADVATWSPGRLFDAVLLDAPCTATGTIRRHPDILHLKRAGDLEAIVPVQARLLESAAALVRPGGRLVYCTCSLEPEEGEWQIEAFLERHTELESRPAVAAELGVEPRSITPKGQLRTLPFHLAPEGSSPGGIDGFFAARLERISR